MSSTVKCCTINAEYKVNNNETDKGETFVEIIEDKKQPPMYQETTNDIITNVNNETKWDDRTNNLPTPTIAYQVMNKKQQIDNNNNNDNQTTNQSQPNKQSINRK
jgi:hypothetical protein